MFLRTARIVGRPRVTLATSAGGARHFGSSTTLKSASPATPSVAPTPPRSFSLLSSSLILITGLFSGVAGALLLPRPKLVSLIFPVPTPVAPGQDTPAGIKWTQEIEAGLQSLKLVKELRESISDSTTGERETTWTESRPYATSIPGPHSLSASTLRGPGRFAVAPLVFTSRDRKSAVMIMHLGTALCGHEGVIHGGLLGTIADEGLARTAFFALPENIGVTATLNLAYKKPTFADQYVVLRTHLVDSKGRKAWVKGTIEDLEGNVLVEAKGLFVQPRMAAFLDKSSVREAMG